MPGKRLPDPSSQQGTPGATWPGTSARRTPSASVARSLEVMPPLATRKRGVVSRRRTVSTSRQRGVDRRGGRGNLAVAGGVLQHAGDVQLDRDQLRQRPTGRLELLA